MLSIKRRLESAQQRDGGFTLIELAVVILIIGILLAIAIPTFLGIRRNAQNKAAQSALRTVLTTAKAKAGDTQSYGELAFADLSSSENSLNIVDGQPSSAPSTVSVKLVGESLVLASRANADGTCFVIVDNVSGDTTGTKYMKKTAGDCTAIVAWATDTNLQDNQKDGWK